MLSKLRDGLYCDTINLIEYKIKLYCYCCCSGFSIMLMVTVRPDFLTQTMFTWFCTRCNYKRFATYNSLLLETSRLSISALSSIFGSCRIPGLTKMCNHTSNHAWFHGSPEEMPTYFYVKITHFPCMARRMVAHFFIMGDFKLDSFDIFTRAAENLYVTMDACYVWLLWYHAWRVVWIP